MLDVQVEIKPSKTVEIHPNKLYGVLSVVLGKKDRKGAPWLDYQVTWIRQVGPRTSGSGNRALESRPTTHCSRKKNVLPTTTTIHTTRYNRKCGDGFGEDNLVPCQRFELI